MTVKILNGQGFIDIAIQETGDADNAFDIALENSLSILSVLTPGTTINMPVLTKKESIVQLFSNPNNKPASIVDDGVFFPVNTPLLNNLILPVNFSLI
jgi:hypothetical protein